MTDSANRRPAGPPGSAARRQTRVLVIVGLVAVAVVASALVGWRFARESTPVTGPILLISIDPLPPAGCRPTAAAGATPHLDRLAAGATVFTHAYGHAAASLPAHASLFTGQLPYDHGVRDDVGFTLAPGAETLAVAAVRPWFRDRRGRVVLPAARRHRARRRLRALRRRAPGGRRRGSPTGRARQRGDRHGGGGLARRAGLGALLLRAAPERHGRRRWHRAGRLDRPRTPASPPPTPPSAGCSRRCGARAGTTTRWSSSPRPRARRPTRTGRGARSRSTRRRCTCRCS